MITISSYAILYILFPVSLFQFLIILRFLYSVISIQTTKVKESRVIEEFVFFFLLDFVRDPEKKFYIILIQEKLHIPSK